MLQLVSRAFGCFQQKTGLQSSCQSGGLRTGVDFWNQRHFRDRDSEACVVNRTEQMPSPAEVEEAFLAFVKELDLSPEKEKALFKLSLKNKWLMICEDGMRKDRSTVYQSADYFVNVLVSLSHRQDWDVVMKELEALRISLKTQSQSYVQRFVSLGGVSRMANCISQFVASAPHFDAVAAAVLACLKVLLNSTDGREAVLKSEETLMAVARSMCLENTKAKVLALEILSGLCLEARGHKRVLEAVTATSTLSGERTRFQRVLFDLWRPYLDTREGLRVKTAILSFVNVLLKSGPSENSLEFRLHLRYELLLLGMQEIVDHLRDAENPVIDNHLDLFDMMREEDEQDLNSSIAGDSETGSQLDYESATSLVDVLTSRLADSVALPHLMSLLQHLMLLPGDRKHVELWRLFDAVLQQISLQSNMNGLVADAYEPLKNFDIDAIVEQLRTENDYDRLEKQHVKLADDYDKLKLAYEHTKTRVATLEMRYSAVDASPRSSTLSSISFSSDSTSPSDPRPSDDIDDPILSQPCTVAAPPAPPMPPPPIDLLKTTTEDIFLMSSCGPRKNVPKSKIPLKGLNWERLSTAQIEGTIWSEMEDEKLYKMLDLAEIDRNFAAGSKADYELADSVMGTLSRRLTRDGVVISVIDARRAQNCTIMLSKLKLTHSQIRHAVLSIDEQGLLPRDMVEQMLKFIPTKEEITSINDAIRTSSPSFLASADRFLLEMSKIPRYEQRLKCLHFLRTFKERVDDVTPLMQAVTRASRLTANSKRLKHFLSFVLAIGNYLNSGKHNSNARGFTVASLHRLQDVKNTLRPERNLLHFLLEVIERQFPDLLRLKRDLTSVFEAARVSRHDINQEMESLDKGLQFIQEEIIVQKNPPKDQTVLAGDRFLQVMSNFAEISFKDYTSLQGTHQDMRISFHACAKHLCVDPLTTSPDELFSVLAKFLTHFSEAHHQLWKEREHEENVKRQTLTRAVFAKKAKHKRPALGAKDRGGGALSSTKPALSSVADGTDFEQLISALQSGELFSADLRRLRTSFRGSPKRPDRRVKTANGPGEPAVTTSDCNNNAGASVAGEKKHQNVQNIIVDGHTRDR